MIAIVFTLLLAVSCTWTGLAAFEAGTDRLRCPWSPGLMQPAGRVATGARLAQLRKQMRDETATRTVKLDAYIVTSNDEHQSEMVAPYDKRREFISGFSGSMGDAVVTMTQAALFVDGRYHIQADSELSCDWLLMRAGKRDVPTQSEWLIDKLPDNATVGADPTLIEDDAWEDLKYELELHKIKLIEVKTNLIDLIWDPKIRPPKSKTKAYVLDLAYAGVPWEEKVATVRGKIRADDADALVITALDEIAWLFNIRGYDIPYNPVVQSYAVVTHSEIYLYVDMDKIDDSIRRHLKNNDCIEDNCVRLRNYTSIFNDLRTFSQDWQVVLLPAATDAKQGASHAIYKTIPVKKRAPKEPIVNTLKAVKNPTEIKGMRRAHIRDAAAVCDFIARFEEEFNAGEEFDEVKLATKLDRFRYEQELTKGLSFPTIVGYGFHGASPHFEPNNATAIPIGADSTIVIDSGGQYMDGTTDVTRTLHMGTPTQRQKEAYTRVLIGQIKLSTLVFPGHMLISEADVLARESLWSTGYDYLHGTGHGIGAFLYVHESPIIVSYSTPRRSLFREGYFLSNEPGYYLEGEFGIRLENIIEVVSYQGMRHHSGSPYLTFQDVTFVPYEPKLLDQDLLTTEHRRWLNNYNAQVRKLVGHELKQQQRMKGFYWMMKKTKYIPDVGPISGAMSKSVIGFVLTVVYVSFIVLI